MRVRRFPTGIDGFDHLVEGGLPRESVTLITGECGTGKTTFGVQFLYSGITKYNETGIMVVLDETPENLRRYMSRFNWDLSALEKKRQLIILDAFTLRMKGIPGRESETFKESFNTENFVQRLWELKEEIDAKRIVFDSLASLVFKFPEHQIRDEISKLAFLLSRGLGCTTLLITEIPTGANSLSRFQVEEFLVDGIILLGAKITKIGLQRYLFIRKMRGTNHSSVRHRIVIEEQKGIRFLGEDFDG
jgi:KaiC/GvpD/RAD55 family RecA-like ATPase